MAFGTGVRAYTAPHAGERKSGGSTPRPGDRWTDNQGDLCHFADLPLRNGGARCFAHCCSRPFPFPFLLDPGSDTTYRPQVASQINLGWNLGNTLEAICGETAWGNPATNQALINSVKAAASMPSASRCPGTAHHDGSTNIPADWMTRVKQVVDMAIGQNMYVIINIHWDGGWLQDHVTFADQAAVNARQNALWTQIANTFKTYDSHLLFAGTNEVHADYARRPASTSRCSSRTTRPS
jgi:hypothetical protein